MAAAVSHAPTTGVTIRDVRGTDELRACQDVQRQAWGITEDGYILPVATMAGAQRVGGVVLGAFDADNRVVGFAFAFLGKLDDRLILYSQLTGVQPAHQNTGVGRLLKLAQRQRALASGLAAVVWAFDPLQASNAAFNLGVLGATCKSYELDMYGPRTDALNAGLATDRLLAEWATNASSNTPAGQTTAWADGVDVIETIQAWGLRCPHLVRPIGAGVTHLQIEIPRRIADVKTFSPPSLAQAWQHALRDAFGSAFEAGFVAVGFSRADPERPRYLLERRR